MSFTSTLKLDKTKAWFDKKIIKNESSPVAGIVKDAIRDSYKRLIFPSVEREVRAELKEIAETQAIDVFGKNLEKLLLTPPMKEKVVLGYDPAFTKTGESISGQAQEAAFSGIFSSGNAGVRVTLSGTPYTGFYLAGFTEGLRPGLHRCPLGASRKLHRPQQG